MEINLRSYRIFYVVSNCGSISKAAKVLFISQPAISKAIHKLEEHLEIPLFIRNPRGVELTLEGSVLYDYVKTAFESLALGEEQIKKAANLGIGHLRIGVSTTLCKYILLPHLKSFIKQYPHIKITIECHSTNRTLKLLEDHKIDVGLIGKPTTLKNLNFFPFGEIEDIFVCTESYLKSFKERESLSLFENTSFNPSFFENSTLMLLDKENMTRQYIDDYFQEYKIKTMNLLEITTMDLLIEFSKIGLGIGCVIKDFVQNELALNQLIQIPLPHTIPKRQIGFAYPKLQTPSQSLQNFLNFFLQI